MQMMAKARARMLLQHPFFASLLVRTEMIEDNSIPTAATDMRVVYYNKEFIEGLSLPVAMFVLAHELGHIMLKHGIRMRPPHFEPQRANIAQDFAINLMLHDSGFEIWSKCCYDRKYEGMSAEEIYYLLSESPPSGGYGGKGDQGGMGSDVLSPAQMSPSEVAEMERAINSKIAEAANLARICGKMPQHLAKLVDGVINPPLPWYELLRDYATIIVRDDESWNRRDRRHPDIYLPGRESNRMGEIVVIGDTSGSTWSSRTNSGSDFFAQLGQEVGCIAELLKPERVRVIWADDADCSAQQVFETGDLIEMKPVGGGGTDMCKPLKFVEQFDPLVVILVTDGYTPWPKSVPYSLIVLSSTNVAAPDILGRTIHI